MVLKLHPDKSSAPDAKEKFQALHEAYSILSREKTRDFYDANLPQETRNSESTTQNELTPKAQEALREANIVIQNLTQSDPAYRITVIGE